MAMAMAAALLDLRIDIAAASARATTPDVLLTAVTMAPTLTLTSEDPLRRKPKPLRT